MGFFKDTFRNLFADEAKNTSTDQFSVTICECHNDVSDNTDYQLVGDPSNMVRFRQTAVGVEISEELPVVGISYHQDASDSFVYGSNRNLILVYSPSKYDRNAIQVIGTWENPIGVLHKSQLGHLPKEVAKEIAKKLPKAKIGAKLSKLFMPIDGNTVGIRLVVVLIDFQELAKNIYLTIEP